jgi:predicted TIM-barrel fold metal-dependent hydrolase
MRIIDAHALLGAENYLRLEAAELLRRMDAHQIDLAVARPMGAELVVDNANGNDRVLKSHSRIKGWATANPWFAERALEELRRSRDLGALGLFLHPSRQGCFPTDPAVVPLLELSAQFDWPVMFHTGSYAYSDIRAVAEVARRFPGTTFVAGFGGYTDMWAELPHVFGEVSNLLLDASMIWPEAIEQIIRLHGPERVLYGSAEPRNRYGVSLRSLERIELSVSGREAILAGNARRLFRLP